MAKRGRPGTGSKSTYYVPVDKNYTKQGKKLMSDRLLKGYEKIATLAGIELRWSEKERLKTDIIEPWVEVQ